MKLKEYRQGMDSEAKYIINYNAGNVFFSYKNIYGLSFLC